MAQLQHKRSLWQGTLIAPWVVPLGIFIATLIGASDDLPSLNVFFEFLLMVILFGVSFTYVVTLALVAPMAFWLRSKNALSAIRLCVWCTILGPITLFIYSVLLNGLSTTLVRAHLVEVLFTMAFGLVTGVVFCLISGVRWCVR
jgi:hypothetical protein